MHRKSHTRLGARHRLAGRMVALLGLASSIVVAQESLRPTPATAATATIGAPIGGTIPCGSVFDHVQEVGTSASYTVPSGVWRLTRWSTEQVGNLAVQMQLYVFRPTATVGSYTLVGKSEMTSTTATGVNTFTLPAPIIVSGGDVLGFRPGSGNQLCGRAVASTSRYRIRTNPPSVPGVGETIALPSPLSGADANIGASLESLALRYNPVNARRLVDTRVGTGAPLARLSAGQVLTIQVGGVGGVPADALAATINLTTATSEPGFLTAYPCDRPRPSTSSVNPKPGVAVANIANVPLSLTGTVCIYSLAPTDLLVDLAGWWGTSGSAYNQVLGARLVDTRAGGRLNAGQTLTVQVAGVGGIPSDAAAATMNLTTINSDPGFLIAYPCDQPRPGTSSVNPQVGTAVANLTNVALSAAGTVCIYTETATDLLVDASGWWGPTLIAYNPITASRLVDTRATTRLTAGETLVVQVAGRGGVATTGSVGATVNLTTVNSDPGYLIVYPCDQTRPSTSSVNPQPGFAVANLASVNLSAAGTVCVFTETPTDLVIDVLGWWGV